MQCYALVCSSPPVNVGLISRHLSGLHILVGCNAWKEVVSLSLELMGGDSMNAFTEDGSLSVMFVSRMVGLFRLKMLDELQQEAAAALASEERRLVSYLSGSEGMGGDNTPSFLLFPRPAAGEWRGVDGLVALQLLMVEVKVVTGRGDEALQLLYTLKQWLADPAADSSGHVSSGSREVMWRWKARWALVNVLLRQRLWREGIKEMVGMLREVKRERQGHGSSEGGEC